MDNKSNTITAWQFYIELYAAPYKLTSSITAN